MKLINNRWYDDENNSWDAKTHTEESAEAKSRTLMNCSDCMNCMNCIDCINCINCIELHGNNWTTKIQNERLTNARH